MSQHRCPVLGCNSKARDDAKHFFKFPKVDKKIGDVSKVWLEFTRRKNYKSTSERICEDHFAADCFKIGPKGRPRLKKGTVPTIYFYNGEKVVVPYDPECQKYYGDEAQRMFAETDAATHDHEKDLTDLRYKKICELKNLCRFCFINSSDSKCIAMSQLENYAINPRDMLRIIGSNMDHSETFSEIICEPCFLKAIEIENFRRKCSNAQKDLLDELEELDKKIQKVQKVKKKNDMRPWFHTEVKEQPKAFESPVPPVVEPIPPATTSSIQNASPLKEINMETNSSFNFYHVDIKNELMDDSDEDMTETFDNGDVGFPSDSDSDFNDSKAFEQINGKDKELDDKTEEMEKDENIVVEQKISEPKTRQQKLKSEQKSNSKQSETKESKLKEKSKKSDKISKKSDKKPSKVKAKEKVSKKEEKDEQKVQQNEPKEVQKEKVARDQQIDISSIVIEAPKSQRSKLITLTDYKKRTYECFFCREKFFGKKLFKKHPCPVKTRECVVPGCGKLFVNQGTYANHVSKTHGLPKTSSHYCPACKTYYQMTIVEYKEHSKKCVLENKFEETPIKCDLCRKVLPDLDSYTAHKLFHGTQNMLIPEYDKDGKPMDPKTMRKTKRMMCDLCGKTLSDYINLRKHKVNVHLVDFKGDMYICDLCPVQKPTRRLIFTHMMSHVVDWQPCDVCGKQFKSKRCLQRHRNFVHAKKNSKIRCQICPNKPGFTATVYLDQHMRKYHLNNFGNSSSSFRCDFGVCDASYSNQKSLDNHKINMHGYNYQ